MGVQVIFNVVFTILTCLPYYIQASLQVEMKNAVGVYSDCKRNSSNSISLDRAISKCNNITSQHHLMSSQSCYMDLGHNIMADNGYLLYSGVCICKFLRPVSNQFFCAVGAYKAWFYTQFLSLSWPPVFNTPDSFYPCGHAVDFPAACYRQYWKYSSQAIAMRDAHKQCLGLTDKTHRHACIHGVGYAFTEKFFFDTRSHFPIDKVCICIDDVTLMIFNIYVAALLNHLRCARLAIWQIKSCAYTAIGTA